MVTEKEMKPKEAKHEAGPVYGAAGVKHEAREPKKPANGPKRPKKKWKPAFTVMNLGFMKSVKDRWRKPRGTSNKKRKKYAFAGALPNIGYRNPVALRGIREDGRKELLVRGMPDIERIKAMTEAERAALSIRFASQLSRRTRARMAVAAKQLGVKLINFREKG